ncbi:MAG: uracil-DNA glycosylase [Bacteroidales bacterium]
MDNTEELKTLFYEVQKCTQCPLHKTRTKAVFGNGLPDSPIMLIGEAPGYDEDQTGKAFVGRSGQLLDKILQACNFHRRKHVFIGNILKCRPPKNRNPEPEEVETCLPYLMKQIELINPKILVTLGAVPAKTLVDKDFKITRQHGEWMQLKDRWLLPTFHPSALLRNPALKRDAWSDFQMIVKKYRELVDVNHQMKENKG